MTTHKDTLLELAARCEQAAGQDQGLDIAIHTAATSFEPRLGGPGWPEWAIVVPAFPGWKLLPTYTASLDAAMTLAPEGCQFTIEERSAWLRFLDDKDESGVRAVQSGLCATTPLALCAASLRARAAQ